MNQPSIYTIVGIVLCAVLVLILKANELAKESLSKDIDFEPDSEHDNFTNPERLQGNTTQKPLPTTGAANVVAPGGTGGAGSNTFNHENGLNNSVKFFNTQFLSNNGAVIFRGGDKYKTVYRKDLYVTKNGKVVSIRNSKVLGNVICKELYSEKEYWCKLSNLTEITEDAFRNLKAELVEF